MATREVIEIIVLLVILLSGLILLGDYEPQKQIASIARKEKRSKRPPCGQVHDNIYLSVCNTGF